MSNKPQSQTFDETWEKICNSFDYIFQFQTIRYSKWMLTYTHIYDFCVDRQFDSAVLYGKIRNYFQDRCLSQSIEGLQDRDILEMYTHFRRKFNRSSKIIHGICSYLNRHHVQRQLDSGNTDVCEIYTLAMKIWNQIIGPLFYPRISEIYLKMIKSEHQNENINIDILPNIIQIFISPDINQSKLDSNENIHMLDIYREYLEKQYLRETQEFYRIEAITYLQQHSVIDYLSKINQYIDDETRRVTLYLHSSTFRKMIQTLEDILIREQLEVLYIEAEKCIANENISDVNLLYRTVNRIQNGKTPLKSLFENHLYQIGHTTIRSLNLISNLSNQDLKVYIETLANLHQKYSLFIQTCFDNDLEFIDILNRIFEQLINNHTIEHTRIMTKLLAQYCDKLLRKKKHDDTLFNQIKIILTYIHDKDIFVNFYSKFLMKRLINQTNISNDYEKFMITNIQTACGFEYVNKMKRMYQDIETSENILNQYLTSRQIDSQIRFSIFILNSNVWPLNQTQNICLPRRFQSIINDFNQFYKEIYHGRKLTWFHQYSTGELRGYFQTKVYTFQVSMYQMIILLLFKNTTELTIEQIQDATQIPIDLLIRNLNLLINLNIFQSINSLNIDMNCRIRLIEDFTSNKHYVNLNQSIKLNEESDIEQVNKTNDRDRLALLRAAIVRTMKANQILTEQILIQTVIEQLSSRFSYEISVIQDCIEMLINGEYLQRDRDRLYYKN